MNDNDPSPSAEEHHYGLLAGLLLAAFVAWVMWLNCGAAFARLTFAGQAPAQRASAPSDAASAPLAAASSAAAASAASEPSTTERAAWFTEMGQTGDAFGSFNALLTAIAGALVAWAGYLQHQSLREARRATKEERTHRQLQEFESLFFRLLELTSKAADQIEGPRKLKEVGPVVPGHGNANTYERGKMGNPAINQFARRVFRRATKGMAQLNDEALLDRLVALYVADVFDHRPSQFGPYFRLLYQTFKHVAEAPLEKEADKVRYANIARGQLPEGAVLLLALNGLSDEGRKFAPLIERFGLLEHMHRRYSQEFHDALLVGYRERAFLGSDARAQPGNEWDPIQKLEERHFAAAIAARKDADEQEDFSEGYDVDEGLEDRE
ncbi:MAG: hypothetical protein C0423_07425 [Methylibium sp.]|nr:hypothetical protein [Methylibium sp.]